MQFQDLLTAQCVVPEVSLGNFTRLFVIKTLYDVFSYAFVSILRMTAMLAAEHFPVPVIFVNIAILRTLLTGKG